MPELDTKNRGCYEQIDPPILRRLPGRPRVNRKRSVIEGCQRDKTKNQKKLQVRRRKPSSAVNATCYRNMNVHVITQTKTQGSSSQLEISGQVTHKTAH
ncbi:hypothetical protein P8452_56693 [Trifolium repens]|nr:hypothetical protein P8452_56693 [Trifolium repens]